MNKKGLRASPGLPMTSIHFGENPDFPPEAGTPLAAVCGVQCEVCCVPSKSRWEPVGGGVTGVGNGEA